MAMSNDYDDDDNNNNNNNNKPTGDKRKRSITEIDVPDRDQAEGGGGRKEGTAPDPGVNESAVRKDGHEEDGGSSRATTTTPQNIDHYRDIYEWLRELSDQVRSRNARIHIWRIQTSNVFLTPWEKYST